MNQDLLSKQDNESKVEKLVNNLEKEILHEQGEINYLESEVDHEKEDLNHLKEEEKELKEELKHHHEHHQDNDIKLIFILNGEATDILAQKDWLLKTAVEAALKETGNEGRQLSDWRVRYNGVVLNMDEKIEKLQLKSGAELNLSLDAGHGGAF